MDEVTAFIITCVAYAVGISALTLSLLLIAARFDDMYDMLKEKQKKEK